MYCLRIFEHVALDISSWMLTAMFLFILLKQLLQTEARAHQNGICMWLCHTATTTEMNREVALPDKSMSKSDSLPF